MERCLILKPQSTYCLDLAKLAALASGPIAHGTERAGGTSLDMFEHLLLAKGGSDGHGLKTNSRKGILCLNQTQPYWGTGTTLLLPRTAVPIDMLSVGPLGESKMSDGNHMIIPLFLMYTSVLWFLYKASILR